MLDFTKEIKLDHNHYKKYVALRIVLHIVFFVSILFIAYQILFPTVSLVFSFANSASLKNNLISPRTISNPNNLAKLISANDTFIFNASPFGSFSEADLVFTTDKKPDSNLENFDVNIYKSYQAFFYPTGKPAGFRDSTLLSSKGNYYIVSDKKLHKFSEAEIVIKLGYSKNSFIEVTPEDLTYNDLGSDVTNADVYPDGTLFAIGDTYYQLQNQKIVPFVSTRAYFSQFEANQAIIKNDEFLNNYPVSDNQLGFADGTLGSFENSVFVLSEGKSYPVADAETFVEMGFNWDDVIPLNSEELNIYQKQKQFDRNQPHPDGIIFFDQTAKKYLVIKNKEKHLLESETVIKNYSKQKFIIADSKESKAGASCQLKKSFFSNQKYYCGVMLDSFNDFLGNNYQIETQFKNEAKISDLNVKFSTPFNWLSLRASLSRIKTNLGNNYISTQQ